MPIAMQRAMYVGESFVGDIPNNGHVNVLVGPLDGPVGAAFAVAIATPSQGHVPFVVVLTPNVAVRPPTLFVNKVAIQNEGHARMTWGPAQAGIATGVQAVMDAGYLDAGDAKTWGIIAAVWVNPEAHDNNAVRSNNATAIVEGIIRALADGPTSAELAAAAKALSNPYFDGES